MKTSLKIFLIFSIVLLFFMNVTVFAVETENTTATNNSAVSSNNVSASATENVTTSNTSNSATNTTPNTSTKSSTQVTSITHADDDKMTLSDILNILLISTGVVLILLAIAILVRLK